MSEQLSYQAKLLAIKNGLASKTTGAKPRKLIAKISAKKQKELNEQKQNGDNNLDKFFQAMRKKCKGTCFICGQMTSYKNDSLWPAAISHLLPKSKFKSIATHESNWIELCMQCHRNFDDGMITWQFLKDSKEWDILEQKLLTILPLVTENERKNKLYDEIIKLLGA